MWIRGARLPSVASQDDRFLGRGAGLRGRYHPLALHQPEHHGATTHGRSRAHVGIEVVRRGDQPGQQGRLPEREVVRIDAEVGARRGLRAVGPLPEVHGVEVPREDLLLREAILHLPGQERLVPLPPEAERIAHVQVLHELLGDRRAALTELAGGEVHEGRASQRLRVDAVVDVEPAVLDRHGGPAEPPRHRVASKDHAVLGRMQGGDDRAVGRVEERGLRERPGPVVVEVGDGAPAREHREHEETGRRPPDRPHGREPTSDLHGRW